MLCGAQVPICEVETAGGLQNLIALSANQADIGFVQLDTLQEMKASDLNIAALQAVLPANANLLHIVARVDGYTTQGERSFSTLWRRETKTRVLNKFSDLKGLPIALVGSAQLLGRMLERQLSIGLQFVDVATDEQALALLRSGEVAALFSVSGWPSGTLSTLTQDSGVTLIPYDLPVQAPHRLIRKNYSNLGVFNNVFLAVPNLLVSRPFKPDGEHGREVLALQRCIAGHLTALQEGSFEPGWKEIQNTAETYGWPRFAAGELKLGPPP
jgi:hypothetical protein